METLTAVLVSTAMVRIAVPSGKCFLRRLSPKLGSYIKALYKNPTASNNAASSWGPIIVFFVQWEAFFCGYAPVGSIFIKKIPPKTKGGARPRKLLTFLAFPQWDAFFVGRPFKFFSIFNISLVGSIFQKRSQKGGGGKTQKTFNIFNNSPVGSTFLWVGPLIF